MKYETYTYTTEELSGAYNHAKNLFVEFLETNKYCTPEQAKDFREEVAFIVVKKGMLGAFLDKILFKDNDRLKVKIVRMAL
jgi:hypothetical protein